MLSMQFTTQKLSGDSGLEGDQKVIAAHGCYAMTATTALTAQNPQTVVDVLHTHPQFVRKQIDACIDDIGVDVVKMGMPRITTCWRYYCLLILPRDAGLRRHRRSGGGGFGASRIPTYGC